MQIDTSFLRNRRVAAQPVVVMAGTTARTWIVADRDDYREGVYVGCGEGNPIKYATEGVPYEVSQDQGWVIVSDRGQYLRSTGLWVGDRRRIRRFKTPAAAARFVEANLCAVVA